MRTSCYTAIQCKSPSVHHTSTENFQMMHQNNQPYCGTNYVENTSFRVPSYDSDKKKRDRFYPSMTIKKFIYKLEESKWLNQKLLRNNKSELAGWLSLIILIFLGYKYFSDGSFSAILTLSSWFQCFSLFLLNMEVFSQRETTGISKRSVSLIVICLVCRLASTLFFNGYLPVDRSGDWLYQGADIISALLGIFLLVYAHYRCASISRNSRDTCYVMIPMIITAVLALIIHPTLNQNFIADSLWTFALYLETYSMVPQLFMMGKSSGKVEALTSHYVASMAACKVLCVLFWCFSYKELAPRHGGYNIAGWAVLISYTLQSLLFADFIYYYIKSIRTGRNMIINL